MVFVPYHFQTIEMALVLRTRESAGGIGPAIKQTIESLGTRRPVYDIRPMQFYVDRSIGDTRFTMLVLGGFAVAALLLAAVGLYGTLAFLTSQRTQAFGVRMALGVSAARTLRSVASEGLLLTAVGRVLGRIGALAVSAVLRDLLHEVAPNDVATLVSVVTAVALVASSPRATPPGLRPRRIRVRRCAPNESRGSRPTLDSPRSTVHGYWEFQVLTLDRRLSAVSRRPWTVDLTI